MADRIKGITVAINGDTTGLDKALKGVNKQIKDTQVSLKDVERLLKLDPKNTELLAQKQKLLATQAQATADRFRELKDQHDTLTPDDAKYQQWIKAQASLEGQITKTTKELAALEKEQAALEKTGVAPDDTQLVELQQEADAARDRLSNLRDQVQQTYDELGRPISTEQYDRLTREVIAAQHAAEEAEDAYKNFSPELERVGAAAEAVSGKLKTVASVTAPISKAAGVALAAIVGTVAGTSELRGDLSKLDNNAKLAGVSIDTARSAFEAFAVATDETDSSVEAVSNLLQAGFGESNLQRAMEGITGAYLKFPDTLKIESLSDSLQETLATGAATGQFGELLDRLGVGADNFSAQLAQIGDTAGRQNYILQMFAQQGLTEAYNAWVSDNEAMTEAKQSQLELQQSMSEFAESIQPIITQVTDLATAFFNWFNGLPGGAQTAIVAIVGVLAVISPIAGILSNITGALGKVSDALPGVASGADTAAEAVGGLFGKITTFVAANPITLIIAAVVALVALIALKGDEIQAALQKLDDFLQNIFAKDWTTVFGDTLGGALNGLLSGVKDVWDGIKSILDGIIDFIRGVFTGDWDRAWQGITEIFGGVFSTLEGLAKMPINGVIALLNGAISAINKMISGINSIQIDVPDWVPVLGGQSYSPNIPEIGSIPYLANGGILSQGSAVVGEAGPELLTMAGNKAVVQPLTATLDPGTAAALSQRGGSQETVVSINFNGSLAQLGRLLQPHIEAETARRGTSLIGR